MNDDIEHSINYLPKWTKRVVTDSGGRDPLGLSRVAFNLTDYLLTGIITTTDRARYYSFYCWVLWHLENQEKVTNFNKYVDSFRRREATLGLATLATNPELNPVGVVVLRSHLGKGDQTGEYDCNFKVLPSNNLGGYGQYYGSSIYHLKLSSKDETGIDRVEQLGTDLSIAFHQTIQNTSYIENQLFQNDTISKRDLKELQKSFTIDSIKEDFAKDERDKLIEIFFSLNENYLDEKSLIRRQTLTTLLYLISKYSEQEIEIDAQNSYLLDQFLLYAIYYEVLWIDEESVLPFQKIEKYNSCYEFWKQFCLHQFITQALEYLLYSVLEVVGREITGVSLSETIESLLQPEFFALLEEITENECNTPSELLNSFGITEIPDEEFSSHLQKELTPIHPKSEAQILDFDEKHLKNSAAKSILLLAVLYGKWRGMFQNVHVKSVAQTVGQELWAKPVLSKLDSWLDQNLSWEEALTNLIEDFILNQHDRIMYEKRKFEGWLHRIDGKIVKDQDFLPSWRASRFFNSTRIMADLRLVNIDEERQITITSEGENLIKNLLEEKI